MVHMLGIVAIAHNNLHHGHEGTSGRETFATFSLLDNCPLRYAAGGSPPIVNTVGLGACLAHLSDSPFLCLARAFFWLHIFSVLLSLRRLARFFA